ncbi:30S ribosomal protein S4 [Candidatus Parcubacteria bacterium]|nr:MAG: 30S ribosomal protein S4 [Candidatus Parcubacteria bacterium]
MAKSLNPKCKQCRRAGEKLFLKGERCISAKCAILKRNYPPGIHGSKGSRYTTSFGAQLKEKQKAKRYYGILERQFRNYYVKTIKKKGNTAELLLQALEMRFDNVVYKLGISKSRNQSRQLINHGIFLVNGKSVNIPSYQIKAKDLITIKPQYQDLKIFQSFKEKKGEDEEIPSWISFDQKKLEAKILNRPSLNDIKSIFNPTLIVEFYSK